MKILVANLGSTSFKYRLYQMDESGGEVVAKGGYERVEDHARVIDDASPRWRATVSFPARTKSTRSDSRPCSARISADASSPTSR